MIFSHFSRKFQTLRADTIPSEYCCHLSDLSHFAIGSYFTRAITASIISRLFLDLCTAANPNVLEFTLALPCPTSLKFHETHTPCHSHREPHCTVSQKFSYSNTPSRVSGACANYFYARFPFSRFKIFTIYTYCVCTPVVIIYYGQNADSNETGYRVNNKRCLLLEKFIILHVNDLSKIDLRFRD